MRFTGGFVPDVNQLMLKGYGIFAYPATQHQFAKLRIMFELAPIAMLIEKAGGMSSDGEHSLLDTPIKNVS
jgi:fructose-1,6-bisphosphatase